MLRDGGVVLTSGPPARGQGLSLRLPGPVQAVFSLAGIVSDTQWTAVFWESAMKPVIALAAALIAAGALAPPAQAHGWDRDPRGGQQRGWQERRPDWRGHGYGHDEWREHHGQGWYAPRFGYGYPRDYAYGPRYGYPPVYGYAPVYGYPRYYRHYYRCDDRDYDGDCGYGGRYYHYDDYRGLDDRGISLLLTLPLRF